VAPTLIPTPPFLADYRGYYNLWSSRDGAVWSEPLAACAVTGQTLGGITAFANGASSCTSSQSRDHGGLDVRPMPGLGLFAAADEWDGDQHVRMWQSKNDNIAFSGEFVLVPYAPALNLAPTRRLDPPSSSLCAGGTWGIARCVGRVTLHLKAHCTSSEELVRCVQTGIKYLRTAPMPVATLH
jgi:hypothetical protein